MSRKKITAEIKRHFNRVADMGCCITRDPICVIHHCYGGSMVPRFGLKSASSRGLGHWLVIPLHPSLHTNGPDAIHELSPRKWERHFGPQMFHLEWVNEQLDYDIFEKSTSTWL